MKYPWLWIIAMALVMTAGLATGVAASSNISAVDRIAEAIAYAEGYYVNGSRPQRNNNPGDLTKSLGFSTIGTDGIYMIFSTIDDGWRALKRLVELMLTNRSAIYSSNMTILDVAQRYTTTQQNEWAANVASRLGVTIYTKISEV